MNPHSVQYISECFIKPKYTTEESKQPVYLAPWDFMMLSVHYIQKGFLFVKPQDFDTDHNSLRNLLEKLKESLSIALVHFYTLSGRLSTLKQDDPHLYSIFIDCVNSPGARFIHASLGSTVTDILSPSDVPSVVQSFFDHDRAINHDGHTMSLLTIQVTELVDGIFIGCSINHAVADGTSFWHFLNSWSEIFKGVDKDVTISRPPIHKHWFPEGYGPILNLPFTHHDQFTSRHVVLPFREKVFHFSSNTLAKIKAKANAECHTTQISTLQALSAHIWQCVTRARGFTPDQETSCRMAINNRTRLNPQLSHNYFGNCIQTVKTTVSVSDLLQNHFGWAALQLHQTVTNHDNERVREWVDSWLKTHFVYQFEGRFFDPSSIWIGSSPRFNMYGNEFGLGKAVALRSGYANKFDGKISLYPGVEGGSSMDLEICLLPEFMSALESDPQFMEAISI